MPTRPSLVARCGATLLLVMFAAACSSGAAATSPAGAQGPTLAAGTSAAPAGQAQGGGAGSVSDGLGHPVNVCTLLPVATVASITGGPFSVAIQADTLPSKTYECDYHSADGSSGLSVSVEAEYAVEAYDHELQAAGSGATQISGLGDKAFSGVLGQEALFGNVLIKVLNLKSDAAAETLIRTLQPKL